MKAKLFFQSLFLFILINCFLGCGKEGCTDPDALNFSSDFTKADNSCQYPFGPEILAGEWKVEEFCFDGGDTQTFTYSLEIREVPGQPNQFVFYNIGQFRMETNVDYENNLITIPEQQIGTFYFVSGEGFLGSNEFMINYDLANNSLRTNCQISIQGMK